ncbi:hypothetical protein HanXRQr2_Chr13g0587661 [Helianthus annuus]|uniref:Uncharacterized protein n=1 Tax=Helianthus annuus TaxID=4232 RepID=A0A251SSE1_HELAN|nr:hypothetical protein HanXRQr2_Chr13g0587661 [Helianthus annuus]KAJ0849175.1 hypothetical protein HanPSC8_Chr13g0565891 [Helianthus annuus]
MTKIEFDIITLNFRREQYKCMYLLEHGIREIHPFILFYSEFKKDHLRILRSNLYRSSTRCI